MHVDFEVHESHIPLFESEYRYAFLMGGRANGRSGTASRYVVSRLLGKEYTRGALMRAVHADIRTSSWAEINDRLTEQAIESAQGLHLVDNEMLAEYGQNSLRAHGFKSSAGSLTARLKSLANYNLVWVEEAEETGEAEFTKLDDTLRTTKGRIRIVFTLNTPAKSHWIIKRFFDLEPHPEQPGFYIPHLKREYADSAIYIPGTFRDFREIVVNSWYIDNLVRIGPHTPEMADALKQAKLKELQQTEPLIKNTPEIWKDVLKRIRVTITGENYDVSENLQTIASVLQFETDPVRRAFLLDTIYSSKGIPVPPAAQQMAQAGAQPGDQNPPAGNSKPTNGQIKSIANTGAAQPEPAVA